MAELLLRPNTRQWLDESKGICLYGTIGHDAYLRADGSVWFYIPVDRLTDPDKCEWRLATPLERWGAILLGAKRYPELRELLPTRRPGDPDCARCKGTGNAIAQVQCPDCGGMGWVPQGVT
jgi:hypothetical protein